MNARLASRLGNQAPGKSTLAMVVDQVGYLVLALMALVASAIATYWAAQLITLSIILGCKWIYGNQVQVIQIFNYEDQ